MAMPCLDCGVVTKRSRCESCQLRFEENKPVRVRADRNARGYDWEWIKIRKVVLDRDKWICGYCGKKLIGADATVDHIQSLDKGGPRLEMSNLISACRSCNSRKKNR